jgi:hypothetical protein
MDKVQKYNSFNHTSCFSFCCSTNILVFYDIFPWDACIVYMGRSFLRFSKIFWWNFGKLCICINILLQSGLLLNLKFHSVTNNVWNLKEAENCKQTGAWNFLSPIVFNITIFAYHKKGITHNIDNDVTIILLHVMWVLDNKIHTFPLQLFDFLMSPQL